MSQALPPVDAPEIYFKEWMAAREIENQKVLARLMGTTPGTISKKLKEPGKVDVEWLARFAVAFEINLVDLFVDPRTLPKAPSPRRPRLDELMDAAEGAGDADLDALIRLARHSSAAPRPEPGPASLDPHQAKVPSR